MSKRRNAPTKQGQLGGEVAMPMVWTIALRWKRKKATVLLTVTLIFTL